MDLSPDHPLPSRIHRPAANEYAPWYQPYIDMIPDEDILVVLTGDLDALLHTLAVTPPESGAFRYGPDKWSVNEVLGHVIDCERIYTYRALRFARGDQTPLPGFDQNAYVAANSVKGRQLADLADELAQVRYGTLAFWRSLDPEVATRLGLANGIETSVRAIAYVTAGHARHHARLLRDRYGVG